MLVRQLQTMTVTEIRELVASRLPGRYEPLNLTFYGRECRPIGEHVVIGDDYGTDLCVSLSDGAVHSIDPKEMLPPRRFVNSGITELAKFIELSGTFADSSAEPEILAQQMQAALTKMDAKAFSDPENWWAVILEQLSYGL